MKRLISILLVTLITISYTVAYSATTPASDPVLSQSDVDSIINELVNGGVSMYNIHSRQLNAGVYRNYGVVSYGVRFGDKDKNGEYRYLGYNYSDQPITNDVFVNDINDSTNLVDRNWVTISDAKTSWDGVIYQEQTDQILKYKPIINDGKSLPLSISDILAKKASTDTARDNKSPGREDFILVLVAPTLLSKGAVKLNRRTSSGSIYYDTFTIPKLPYNFTPKCTISSGDTFMLQPDQSSVDIPVTVSSPLNTALSIGKTAKDLINSVSLKFESSTKPATADNPSALFTKTVYAKDLKVGVNKLTITGYANLKSIYGDVYNGIQASKVITVIKPDPGNPAINLDPSVNPDYIQFSNQDIKTVVKADVSLIGYTNASNIQDVKIYSKLKEDTTAQLQTKSAALNTSVSFTFTIDKGKISGNSYTQEYVVTAVYEFKTPVNGKSSIQETKSVSTVVYKTAPPSPPVDPGRSPTAEIRTSKVVMAGETVNFDGTGSYDPDGTITAYDWSLPGVSDISDPSASKVTGWFSSEGTYTIGLTVTDNSGLTGSTQAVVTVLPPKPSLVLKQLGSQKENRKVTLDLTNSRSPSHYPLKPELTSISITPVSDGTAGDIKMAGSLTGVLSADVLFKKAGVYNVHASIQNTVGYTDQVDVTLNITADAPPAAGFAVQNTVIRDPDDANNASLTYIDQSYSSDGDYIARDVYKFIYDKDNNGVFDNEVMTIDTSNYNNSIPYNLITPWGDNIILTVKKDPNASIQLTMKGKNVGWYKAELTAIEGFGQETLPQFIVESDYKRDDTSDIAISTKKTNVINIAPSADFELIKKKYYDIVIVTDYAGSKYTNLQTSLTAWKSSMLTDNVDIKFNYITQKSKIGQQSKVVTNYMYARRMWVSCRETGNDQILGRTPTLMSWTDRPNIIYGCYETVWSDIPNPLPGFSKPLPYNVTTQSYNNSYMFGTSRGTSYIFYDPNNYSGTAAGIDLDTYSDGAYWGCRTNSYSNIQTGMDNYWYNTGNSQNKTLTYDVYGMDFSTLNSIVFRNNAEKIMLIFSDNNSTDYSYTNPNGTGYNFGSLKNTVKDYVKNNNMAVYTVVPNYMLDIKYNANNYNTDISSQQISLRELVNSSPVRGKFLAPASWMYSLDYLKYRNPVSPISVTVDNNTVRFKLNSPANYDMLTNYIKYLNTLSDPQGNQINNIAEMLITNVTGKDQGTPELYGGLIFEDAVGPANNGKTLACLGSLSQPGNKYRYIIGTSSPINTPAAGADASGWPLISNGGMIACSNGTYIGVAEVDASNKVVRFSSGKAVVIDEAH